MPTKFGCDAGTGGQRLQRDGSGLERYSRKPRPRWPFASSRRHTYGIIGAPWTQPPSRSASPMSMRFCIRKYAS
jgi:hypothetical protein